jgi:hypothetical protein
MDLFKFPFLSEVWGTVSDWAALIVYAITGYLIYKTLKSQQEVQQTQNRLLKIEQLRIREDFKPNLKYSRVDLGGKLGDESKLMISIAVKNISESPAIKFNIIHEKTHGATFVIARPMRRTLKCDEEHETMNFVVDNEKEAHLNCTIYFTIEYEDVTGTGYTQTVLFDACAGYEEFRTYDPTVIKEIEL